MILRAKIRTDDGSEAHREIEVVANSFEQGVAELEAQTPDGWKRVDIIVAR